MWEASGSAYLRLLCTSACVTLPASRRTKESWVFHDLCDDGELARRILLRGTASSPRRITTAHLAFRDHGKQRLPY